MARVNAVFQVQHVNVVLAALRAMQACCVAAGFVMYSANQEIACELVYGGMAALVGILADDSQPALVRAEAAHVLGCVALGRLTRLSTNSTIATTVKVEKT